MARKDYYVILGVSRTETPGGIRAAYRDLAKRFHPDRVGDKGTAAFQEINEAYEILSDPERRRRYNNELRRAEEGVVRTTSPFLYRSGRPEPPVPERVSLFRRPEEIRPSFEALYERILRNFTAVGVPKADRLESLNFQVILSPKEASVGGRLSIEFPVFRTCSECGGYGRNWLFPCLLCHMQGFVEEEETVQVHIPPVVKPGTFIEVPLRGLGIHNLYLRVRISIGGEDA